MTREHLEKQLDSWKKMLLLFLGAAITLAASTLGVMDEYFFSYGWVAIWIVAQLGAAPIGFLLLFDKEWRKLPLSQRLNTAFGYLTVIWLCWLAVGFRIVGNTTPQGFAFILFIGGVLGAIYYLLHRRTRANASEEMFP